MITHIRSTTSEDLPAVMNVYDAARKFMQANGNETQWMDGYPSEALIAEEIQAGHSFVCENEEGDIVGTFCFIIGEDATYKNIYEGNWLNSKPYATLHRIASSGTEKRISQAVLDWCFLQYPNIRVDTHRDNTIMQRILKDYGFEYCGIIYVSNGSERLAYQKITKNRHFSD